MTLSSSMGSAWAELSAAPRQRLESVDRNGLPAGPGVTVWFREGNPSFVGKCVSLRGSLGSALASQGPSSVSPLRRSVAEFQGIATAQAIASGRYRPTAEDHASISTWIRSCELVWVECASETEAVKLEARLRAERGSIASR